MRKTTSGMIAAFVAAALTVGAAVAGPSVVLTDNDIWNTVKDDGPFAFQPFGFDGNPDGIGKWGADKNSFVTFEVTRGDDELFNGQFFEVAIGTDVFTNDGTESRLDDRAAFLYTIFLEGTLGDKMRDYDPSGQSDFTYFQALGGQALQDAMWFIEGKTNFIDGLGGALVTMANNNVRLEDGDWFGKGLGHIVVLSLTGGQDGAFSEQVLASMPLPMPAFLGLAGLIGVAGLTLMRRRLAIGVPA